MPKIIKKEMCIRHDQIIKRVVTVSLNNGTILTVQKFILFSLIHSNTPGWNKHDVMRLMWQTSTHLIILFVLYIFR